MLPRVCHFTIISALAHFVTALRFTKGLIDRILSDLLLQVFILVSVLFFASLGASLSTSKKILVQEDYGSNFIEPSIKSNTKLCGECVNFAEKFMTELISIIYGKFHFRI